MSELTIVTAKIRSRHRLKEEGAKGLSKRQLYAQGTIDVYDILNPGGDAVATQNVCCAFLGKNQAPAWFRKGRWVKLAGYFCDLTKKTRIFQIDEQKSFLLSIKAMEQILTTKGIHTDQQRNKAIQDGFDSLQEAIVKGAAAPEVTELYNQDVACVDHLLQAAGFKYDIEMACQVYAFFARRAKIRSFDSVSAMLTENPWLLAELEEFKLPEVKKAVQILNPKLAKEVPVYAEMCSHIAAASRRGHLYQPLNHLAYLMGETLRASGCPEREYSRYLCNLSQTVLARMPHRALSRVVVSGQNDYAREAQEYYTKRFAAQGRAKADYWGKQAGLGIYLAKAYFSEKDAAAILAGLCRRAPLPCRSDDLEGLAGLDADQQTAIRNALNYQVSAITGYAGTGKTHTISTFLQILKTNRHQPIVLAPSAIAAQIAAQKIRGGNDYATIHRYAGIGPDEEDLGEYGERHESADEAVKHKIIIVDEMSMTDMPTFAALLHAIKDSPAVRLVLVGDTAQLPSIGPSGFFQQIAAGELAAYGLPVTQLNTLHRSGDALVQFTTAIRQGAYLDAHQFPSVCESPLHEATIVDIAAEFKAKGIGLGEILFLTPTKSGEYGVDRLNRILRPVFLKNPAHIADLPLCIGDPVIAIKNDYADRTVSRGHLFKIRHPGRNISIFNGTRGIIRTWDEARESVAIEFNTPDGSVTMPYTAAEILSWVNVAYGLTVHKAQGSEANHVVFIKPRGNVGRNMIYTAATRAKQSIHLVGGDWQEAVSRINPDPYSKFLFRVKDAIMNRQLHEKFQKEAAPKTTERSLFMKV